MNSLNETVSMETEASAPPEIAGGPEGRPGEGAGGPSYHNTFMNCEEKPLKMEATGNHSNDNSSASCFSGVSQDFPTPHSAGVPQPQSQSQLQGVPSGYHLPTHCPANVNKKPAGAATDNAKYTYTLAPNQSQCPVTGATSSSHPAPANQNVFSAAGETQKQTSCPWKLSGGAKVLVRNTPVNLSRTPSEEVMCVRFCWYQLGRAASNLSPLSSCSSSRSRPVP